MPNILHCYVILFNKISLLRDVISCERASKAIVAIETEEKSKENDWNEVRQLRQKLADDAEVNAQMAEVEATRAKMCDTRQRQQTYLELGEFIV